MGASEVKFEEKTLHEYEETTPFNRAEIAHTFKLFADMYHSYNRSSHQDHVNIDAEHIYKGRGFANTEAALPVSYIVSNFPHLRANPLGTRICQAFVVSTNGWMTFTEFLDMVSSFSTKTDLEKKVPHAFQIFDLDGDGLISKDDLRNLMDLLTRSDEDKFTSEEEDEWSRVKEWMVDGIFCACNKKMMSMDFEEEDSDEDEGGEQVALHQAPPASGNESQNQVKLKGTYEALTIEDFRFCLYRSPDFKNTFSFNL